MTWRLIPQVWSKVTFRNPLSCHKVPLRSTALDLGYRARFHAATLRFNDALLQAYIGSLARSDAAAHQNPTSPGRR